MARCCRSCGEILQTLGCDYRAIEAAIGESSGAGFLVTTSGTGTQDHAGYIVLDPTGDIAIVKIDDLDLDRNRDLVLKIDVEGAEINALKGAATTIRHARKCCIFIEVHPDVLGRTGDNANELLHTAEKIRTFRWLLADDLSFEIDAGQSVFDQVGEIRQMDLIGVAT